MKRLVCVIVFLLVSLAFAEDELVSKRELYLRARDVLKESLENGDTVKANEAFEYLKENAKNGAPLNHFEEYLIAGELNHYDEAVEKFAMIRRVILDSSYTNHLEGDQRNSVDDGLNNYLYRGLDPFTKNVMDSLNNRVQQSSASDENKALYEALLYGDPVVSVDVVNIRGHYFLYQVIRDTTYAEEFLKHSKEFVQKYPQSEHAKYLKDQTIPFVQKYMDLQREFRKNPLKHKYYTGGVGIYYSRWMGFITGDATDYISMDMGSEAMFELELQFRRLNLGFLIAYGIDGERKYKDAYTDYDDMDGGYYLAFTAGVDVFDSRFLKVVPFIGLGSITLEDLDIDAHNYFVMGSSVDIRLWSTTPKRLGALAASVQLRLKYMVGFSSYKDSYQTRYVDPETHYTAIETHPVSGDYVNQSFSVGLGLYFW